MAAIRRDEKKTIWLDDAVAGTWKQYYINENDST